MSYGFHCQETHKFLYSGYVRNLNGNVHFFHISYTANWIFFIVQDHDESDDSDDNEVTEETTSISHVSAFKMFDGCICWLQQQEEACLYNIQTLQELRELAARKRVSAIKQRKISDFFS